MSPQKWVLGGLRRMMHARACHSACSTSVNEQSYWWTGKKPPLGRSLPKRESPQAAAPAQTHPCGGCSESPTRAPHLWKQRPQSQATGPLESGNLGCTEGTPQGRTPEDAAEVWVPADHPPPHTHTQTCSSQEAPRAPAQKAGSRGQISRGAWLLLGGCELSPIPLTPKLAGQPLESF